MHRDHGTDKVRLAAPECNRRSGFRRPASPATVEGVGKMPLRAVSPRCHVNAVVEGHGAEEYTLDGAEGNCARERKALERVWQQPPPLLRVFIRLPYGPQAEGGGCCHTHSKVGGGIFTSAAFSGNAPWIQ